MESSSNAICDTINIVLANSQRETMTITTIRTKVNEILDAKHSRKDIIEAIKGDSTLFSQLEGENTMKNANYKEKVPQKRSKTTIRAPKQDDNEESKEPVTQKVRNTRPIKRQATRETGKVPESIAEPFTKTKKRYQMVEFEDTTEDVPEINQVEFILMLRNKYQELDPTENIEVNNTIIQAIKFVNTQIYGKTPNTDLLKFFEKDDEIRLEQITKYHYAPYITNIAISLVIQQKTEKSKIKDVFLQNIFKILAIVCSNGQDQVDQIQKLNEDFEKQLKFQTSINVAPNQLLKLSKQFTQSVQFLQDIE